MGIKTVKLADIRENPVALRAVNKQSEDYLGLVDSIKQAGFIGTISVRSKTDEAGDAYYELVDGLHRFNASKDAGLVEIPVTIVDLDDAETLQAQIMMNIHKVETKPVQYSEQLRRLLAMDQMLTINELAAKLGKSAQWLKERLTLTKLPESVATLVDDEKINLTNAYTLAKLPEEEMGDWVDRAMTEPPSAFVPMATKRIKEIKDAKRKGQKAGESSFTPTAHLQKLATFKEELETPKIGPKLVKTVGVKTAEEGFALGVKWALSLDPESVQAQEDKYNAQKQAREDAKARRAAERAKKKADAAAKEAAEAEAAIKGDK